jgi:hypothetical protein
MRFTASLTVAASLVALCAQPMRAQRVFRGPPPRVGASPLTPAMVELALISTLAQDGATISIVRDGRSQPNRRDAMLVTPEARPQELAVAYRMLAMLRARVGDSLPGEVRAFVRPSARNGVLPADELSRASNDLERLLAAPEGVVRGVGRARRINVLVRATEPSLP